MRFCEPCPARLPHTRPCNQCTYIAAGKLNACNLIDQFATFYNGVDRLKLPHIGQGIAIDRNNVGKAAHRNRAHILFPAKRLRAARSPRERVSAVIAGNFPANLFTREISRAFSRSTRRLDSKR